MCALGAGEREGERERETWVVMDNGCVRVPRERHTQTKGGDKHTH